MITDPRLNQLAEVLTGFSTRLQKGERVLIDAFDVPDAMVVALVRAARKRGALPFAMTLFLPLRAKMLQRGGDRGKPR